MQPYSPMDGCLININMMGFFGMFPEYGLLLKQTASSPEQDRRSAYVKFDGQRDALSVLKVACLRLALVKEPTFVKYLLDMYQDQVNIRLPQQAHTHTHTHTYTHTHTHTHTHARSCVCLCSCRFGEGSPSSI